MSVLTQIQLPSTDSDLKSWINKITWLLFDALRDESIKLSIWKIPVSIKIAKLEPLITRMVGPRQE